MLGQNLKVLAQLFRVHDRACLALPSQRFQCRKRRTPRRPLHFSLQVGLVGNFNSLIGQIPGERLRAGSCNRRARQEIRRQHARRQGAVAPYDFVKQLFHSFYRGEQRVSRRALHRVPAQGADGGSAEVVESDVGAYHFRQIGASAVRYFSHAHVAEQSVRQPVRQCEPLPPERQISDPFVGSGRCASCPHYLKATVQHERVNLQPAAANRVRQGHLAQRLARPGPERL